MITAITMFDDVNVSLLPKGAPAYAGYVDGRFQTFPVLQRMFPKAILLSIAVFPQDDAECLDVENGDATIADIFGWFKRQQARKAWRPVVYSSVVNMDHIAATMTANGFHRSSYRLWSAHYGAGPHICGPSSCGLCREPCDGTQWTSSARGENLDQSLLLDSFFPAPPLPVPVPEDQMAYPLTSLATGGPAVVLPIPAHKTSAIIYADLFNSGGPGPQLRAGFDKWDGPHIVSPTWDVPAVIKLPAGATRMTVSRVDPGNVPVTVDFA